MFPRTPDRATQSDCLATALRTIRKRRGLTVKQAARAMELSLRSYERFEAGQGEIRLERLFRFAAVTNSDPLALIAGIYLTDATLALRCADHKLVLIHAMALKRFALEVGDGLAEVDVVTLIDVFSRAYAELGNIVTDRRELARIWLKTADQPPPDAEDPP